jgi:hypothetical protein
MSPTEVPEVAVGVGVGVGVGVATVVVDPVSEPLFVGERLFGPHPEFKARRQMASVLSVRCAEALFNIAFPDPVKWKKNKPAPAIPRVNYISKTK